MIVATHCPVRSNTSHWSNRSRESDFARPLHARSAATSQSAKANPGRPSMHYRGSGRGVNQKIGGGGVSVVYTNTPCYKTPGAPQDNTTTDTLTLFADDTRKWMREAARSTGYAPNALMESTMKTIPRPAKPARATPSA